MEELDKKDLHDPDNHDGVITDLEPDILECEVKWALESITTNKASGGDGIPVELFQILKEDAVKVLHSICQQIWKTQQWPRPMCRTDCGAWQAAWAGTMRWRRRRWSGKAAASGPSTSGASTCDRSPTRSASCC